MESFTPRSARWITAENIIKVRAKQLILPLALPSLPPLSPHGNEWQRAKGNAVS